MSNLNTPTEKTIVAFHIGRGGRFYNQGFISYLGKKDINELISLNDSGKNHSYIHFENENEILQNLQEKFGKEIWENASYNGKSFADIFQDDLQDKTEEIAELFGFNFDELGSLNYFDQNGGDLGVSVVNDGTGLLDWDGQYDSDRAMLLEDCDENECELILLDANNTFEIDEDMKEFIFDKYPNLKPIEENEDEYES